MTKERHTVWSRINEGKANELLSRCTYTWVERKRRSVERQKVPGKLGVRQSLGYTGIAARACCPPGWSSPATEIWA